MWKKGSIRIGNQSFTYCAKVYGEPSEDYGIEGGRISKLEIQTGFLYSSRQMAAAFTGKVKKHYEIEKLASGTPAAKDTAEKGRSVDALMDRLNLLHTMM